MRPSEAVDVIDALMTANVPVMLWGEPGTGKTEWVRKWGADRGYQVTTFLGSVHEPTDVGGMPHITAEGTFDHALPKWFARIVEGGEDEKWIIFLDEVNTSPPDVMAAMLLLIQSREIRGVTLPSTTRIIAAGNPPETMSLALPLPTAMQSRMAHIDWEPADADEALMGEIQGWPTPHSKPFTDNSAEKGRWDSMIAAFKKARPAIATAKLADSGNVADAGRGYPCLRAWSNLGRALGCVGDIDRDGNLSMSLASSIVGDGPGKELIHYVKDLDLPDPAEWIADPTLAVPLGDDSRTAAAVMAVAAEAVRQRCTAKVWSGAMEAITKIAEARSPGLCMPAVHILSRRENVPRQGKLTVNAIAGLRRVFGDVLDDIKALETA